MPKPIKMAAAGPTSFGRNMNTEDPKGNVRSKMRPVMKYNAPWIKVSMTMARKRLPIPAKGNSRAICSGVSIFS